MKTMLHSLVRYAHSFTNLVLTTSRHFRHTWLKNSHVIYYDRQICKINNVWGTEIYVVLYCFVFMIGLINIFINKIVPMCQYICIILQWDCLWMNLPGTHEPSNCTSVEINATSIYNRFTNEWTSDRETIIIRVGIYLYTSNSFKKVQYKVF